VFGGRFLMAPGAPEYGFQPPKKPNENKSEKEENL